MLSDIDHVQTKHLLFFRRNIGNNLWIATTIFVGPQLSINDYLTLTKEKDKRNSRGNGCKNRVVFWAVVILLNQRLFDRANPTWRWITNLHRNTSFFQIHDCLIFILFKNSKSRRLRSNLMLAYLKSQFKPHITWKFKLIFQL